MMNRRLYLFLFLGLFVALCIGVFLIGFYGPALIRNLIFPKPLITEPAGAYGLDWGIQQIPLPTDKTRGDFYVVAGKLIDYYYVNDESWLRVLIPQGILDIYVGPKEGNAGSTNFLKDQGDEVVVNVDNEGTTQFVPMGNFFSIIETKKGKPIIVYLTARDTTTAQNSSYSEALGNICEDNEICKKDVSFRMKRTDSDMKLLKNLLSGGIFLSAQISLPYAQIII